MTTVRGPIVTTTHEFPRGTKRYLMQRQTRGREGQSHRHLAEVKMKSK